MAGFRGITPGYGAMPTSPGVVPDYGAATLDPGARPNLGLYTPAAARAMGGGPGMLGGGGAPGLGTLGAWSGQNWGQPAGRGGAAPAATLTLADYAGGRYGGFPRSSWATGHFSPFASGY